MEINSHEINAGLSHPLKMAIVADLHSIEYENLLFKLREISPDAILCPGDILHRASPDEKGLDFLREASKLCGVFCSIGNHEVKHGKDIRDDIRATGAILLDNEAVGFHGVTIGGLSSGYSVCSAQARLRKTPPPALSALDGFFAKKGFKILLSHHPEYYPRYLKDKRVDLIISGHAHGGQWRFFGRGLFAPGQGLFPKYTSGLYDKKLLVSRGLSNHTFIPRIFNKTELVIINLK
jgi:predicted MPP superfamily phosphohydrolase